MKQQKLQEEAESLDFHCACSWGKDWFDLPMQENFGSGKVGIREVKVPFSFSAEIVQQLALTALFKILHH